jgi:acylphosphatase
MLVARRFVLSGRVQGVGFRFFAEHAARMEGLAGWVRNQADGSVEVSAEGDQEAVLRFEAKLRRGPAGARLERVDAFDDTPSGRPAGEFTIQS